MSAVLLIPLMYVSMGGVMFGWDMGALNGNPMGIAIYELVFSFVILVINGKFFVSGTKAIFHRAPNMDTLVSMGSGISFVYSVALMIRAGVNTAYLHHLPHTLYFESAAMILVLITLGKTLEIYSKGKTTSAIKGLMNLAPETARVIKDGEEKEIPLSSLSTGDAFVVRPGENFPADGVILSGSGSVNESAVTGESMPVDKSVGDKVISGTTNVNGYITAKPLPSAEIPRSGASSNLCRTRPLQKPRLQKRQIKYPEYSCQASFASQSLLLSCGLPSRKTLRLPLRTQYPCLS